jgi:predicted DCC family thiol-disulfide oxidoreductase YuxK
MKSAWSGGQYSLYRVALGLTLAIVFGSGGAWVDAALAGFFALGFFDRTVALALAIELCLKPSALGPGRELDALLIASVLVAHCWLPASPFGSLGGRGRLNPGNGWHYPVWVSAVLWIEILALYPLILSTPSWSIPIFGLYWLHLAALGFFWLPGARKGRQVTLFFDGECGLCLAVVRWVLAEDRAGTFYFSPLQGVSFAQAIGVEEVQSRPNTVLVWIDQETWLSHSDAVLFILAELGGLWRILGLLLHMIPKPVRDWGYRRVAHFRRRLYVQPKQSCPILSPELEHRFYP